MVPLECTPKVQKYPTFLCGRFLIFNKINCFLIKIYIIPFHLIETMPANIGWLHRVLEV